MIFSGIELKRTQPIFMQDGKMFLIELTYKKDLAQVDLFLKEHVDFLDSQYLKGTLIFSGRKNPRDGGLLLSHLDSREKVESMIKEDPFHREQIATYRVVEFIPTKYDSRFACFIK
jgi:uncharacterized protein YciI